MSDRVYTIDEIKTIVAPIARQHGVAEMYLFGSYAREEASLDSDLDFRIEKGEIKSLLQLADFQIALEDAFQKEIDVLTTQMIAPSFLKKINTDEVLIYMQG